MNNIANSVLLTGNLGKDVEILTLADGSKVAKTSVATNHFYKNSSGEKIQEVTWHNLVAWNKTAELMDQLLKKGALVQFQGMIKNETYKSKEGEVRYATKVKVNRFRLLTPKDQPVEH